MRRCCLALSLLVVFPCVRARGDEITSAKEPAADAARSEALHVPLRDGRLAARDLLEAVAERAGIEIDDRFHGFEWSIDVESLAGRLQLDALDRFTNGAVRAQVDNGGITFLLDRGEVAELDSHLREKLASWIDAAQEHPVIDNRAFGLTVAMDAKARSPLDALPAETSRAVVLIHGLDDPGYMWQCLIPELLTAKHVVLRFEYPNDQPIADSADLLAAELAKLRERGITNIDIVAHSMGGLVARDALTRATHYNCDGTGCGRFPSVDRLIMLGTPNHGAPLARLRGAAEFREFVSRVVHSDAGLRDALEDGAGEAGRDLLPGSDFLRRLNARPHASHTKYTIIAGRVSPLSGDELDDAVAKLRGFAESAAAPRWLRNWGGRATSWTADAAMKPVMSAIHGLGDGLVSVESTRLDGVEDFVLIEADHAGMLINVLRSKKHLPAAIPVVMERLGAPIPH